MKSSPANLVFTAIYEWGDRLADRHSSRVYSIINFETFCELTWESAFPPLLFPKHPNRRKVGTSGQQNRNSFTTYSTCGHRAIKNYFVETYRPSEV